MRGGMLWALMAGLVFMAATPAMAGEFVKTSDGVVSPYQGTAPLPVRRPRPAATPTTDDFERAIAAGEQPDVIVVMESDSTMTSTPMTTGGFRRGPCGPCGTGTYQKMTCDPCGVGRCAKPSCGYAGVSIHAFPGLGVGIEFGKIFKRASCITWSWELNLNYQDMTDGFNGIDTGQSGKWNSARIGVKASFFPDSRWHPTARAGFGWAIVTGDTLNSLDFGEIDRPEGTATNYFGGYVGVGLEYDFHLWGQRWTTGPEFFIFGGAGDQGSDSSTFTGTIAWHLLLNF